MMKRNLSEALANVRKDEQHAVLAFLVTDQLHYFGSLPLDQIRGEITSYYAPDSENYRTIQSAVFSDKNNHPILYCCYALITMHINELDLVRLGYTVSWLEEQADKNPLFLPLFNSMLGIQNMLQSSPDDRVSLPTHCYLNFSGAALANTDFSNQDLRCANLSGANAQGANFSNAILDCLYAPDADFSCANLTNASLDYATLSRSILKRATLTNASMNRANLSDVVAEHASFHSIKAPSACFVGANMHGADLTHASLVSAKLNNANFSHAVLNSSTLTGACVDKTNFDHSLLIKSDLRQVNLNGTYVEADLSRSDLRGAKLCSKNLNLTNANLANAIMDSSTQFFYVKGKAPSDVYQAYIHRHKAELAQAKFFENLVFEKPETLDKALVKLYQSLKDHMHFNHLQAILGCDLMQRAKQLPSSQPALANELRLHAYESPLFQPNMMFFRAANHMVDKLHEVIGVAAEPYAFESDAQIEIRTGLPLH